MPNGVKFVLIALLLTSLVLPALAQDEGPWYRSIGIGMHRDGMYARTYHTTGDIWWVLYGPSILNEGNSIHRFGYGYYAQADVYRDYFVQLGFRQLNQPTGNDYRAHYSEYVEHNDGSVERVDYSADINDMADLYVIDIFGGYRYVMHPKVQLNVGVGVSWFRSESKGKGLFGGFGNIEFKPVPMLGFQTGIKFAQRVRFSEKVLVRDDAGVYPTVENTIHLEWDSWCYYFGLTVYPMMW